jgi:mismatch-specific thymine-DNA glycosylase
LIEPSRVRGLRTDAAQPFRVPKGNLLQPSDRSPLVMAPSLKGSLNRPMIRYCLRLTDREPLPCLSDHGLVIVLIGINPSLMAAATGDRFPEPSNRFSRVIHLAGFSAVLLRAGQDRSLSQYGCGLTSATSRPTRRPNELSRTKTCRGERHRPKWITFLGKGAYSAVAHHEGERTATCVKDRWHHPERFPSAL